MVLDVDFIVMPHHIKMSIFVRNDLSCFNFLSVQGINALATLSRNQP